ncbi:MAG: hypothetical protein HYY02_04080 [Chloroflexi bacterium]|nr:hypothetical protein [Chloroflexota bacterium]
MDGKRRPLPRPFSFHWGGGQIVEEASYAGQHHEPTLQLLEYEDGSLSVRFCSYSHSGHFQRTPLMVGEADLTALRDELEECPRLRELLRRLTA